MKAAPSIDVSEVKTVQVPHKDRVPANEIEIVMAWANGEVSYTQIATALKLNGENPSARGYSWVVGRLMRAVRLGQVVIAKQVAP